MSVRVLHVSKEFEPSSSGVARHVQGLFEALRGDSRLALSILAPRIEADAGRYRLIRGGFAQLRRSLPDYDLLHVHGARTPLAALGAWLARRRGVPVVYTPHCYYDGGSPLRRLLKRCWDLTVERALVGQAGAVILLHEGWVADLARRGLKPRRVFVLPNCIDAVPRQPQADVARLEGAPAILSIGRLDPVKRLDDVMAALAGPGLATGVLHIVGRGDDRARLEAQAARLGVQARVRFHGWQDDAASARMMLGCDLMVLASEREGMPTVVLEALLAGVPIVCSDIDGCRSIADAVGWQALYPLGDIQALGQCLLRTAGTPVPAEVVAAVARGFTWQHRAPQLAALYGELQRAGRART